MLETGYAHPGYAAALAEFGTLRRLANSGGWILERPIPGSGRRDAMGAYPLFVCRDWSRLPSDLDDLRDHLVSLALVSDPFGAYAPEELSRHFDVMKPFKEHYVTDLSTDLDAMISKHHRKYARKAMDEVDVQVSADPRADVRVWSELYGCLVERHGIKGLRAFSRSSFEKQLALPGLTLYKAMRGAECLAAELWLEHAGVAYYHLAASSAAGYECGALYAVHWHAMHHFAGTAQWIDHGAGAGLAQQADGLTAFKRGWATGTRIAYFCGKVLDPPAYEELCAPCRDAGNGYFPAYRFGEFQ